MKLTTTVYIFLQVHCHSFPSDREGVMSRGFDFETILQQLNTTFNGLRYARENGICTGPRNGLICNFKDFAHKLRSTSKGDRNLVRSGLYKSRAPGLEKYMKIQPTPWLSLGEAQFYANDYIDFVIFETFFSRAKKGDGVYLETGASNGVHASNSLFFDRFLGWKGILVEPTPCAICQLPFNRPRAKNYYGGVCAQSQNISITPMRSFCPHPQDSCDKTLWDRPVQCHPLQYYIDKSGVSRIDFMSIDVEQHFMAALNSIAWERMDIKVIVIECNTDACFDFLRKKGYFIVKPSTFSGTRDDVIAWK